MHIENFKVFSDLVESESFSRAAKLNGLTQSAVSQQLRSMEKHFGALIVDRSQKQFRLTREGRRLYAGAKDLLHRYEKLSSELQELRRVISGTIHLSTIYSAGLHELPPYIKSFMQSFPSVNVRVEYRRSNLVYEDILRSSVDLGLVAFPVPAKQLEVIPFLEDRLVVICSPDNPALGKRAEVDLKDLAGQKLIGFDPDIPTRKATDEILREHFAEVEPVMEFDNVETVKRAVEINAGVAILPHSTVRQEVSQGALRELRIRGRQLKRPLAILYRRGRVLTPAMKRFVSHLTGKPFPEPEADSGNGAKARSLV